MGLVRAFRRPAGDAALSQPRRRQIRFAPRHPVQKPGHGRPLRREYAELEHHDGGRRPLPHPLPDHCNRSLVDADAAAHRGPRQFQGSFLPHRAMAARAGRFQRQARRRDRHRGHRRANHPDHCQGCWPSHRVPAHAELVRAAAQRQDRRRDAEADQGRLSRDVRPLPGDLCLLPAHAGPARRVRGFRRGARGVLRKALWRTRLRHLAGQFPRHPDRSQGECDDQRFRRPKNPPAGEEPRRSRKN